MISAKAGVALRVLEAAYPYRTETGWLDSAPTAEVVLAAESVLTALYLAGAPRGLEVSHRRWTEVLRTLRAENLFLSGAVKGLRRRGLREEALTLETRGLLDWAERRVGAGVVLTAASREYPAGWIRKLGSAAPAAISKRGELPSGPFLAVVGSRRVRFAQRQFAKEIGAEAVRLGYAVVSGAAAGCDRAAAVGAMNEERRSKDEKESPTVSEIETYDGRPFGSAQGRLPTYEQKGSAPLVEILPCGMGVRRERFRGCVLSPFAPYEDFSGPNAMRRNALIYSMADAVVVVHARFGEGGTWRGAIEANRRKLCRLIVKEDANDPAARALIGLGAYGLICPSDLARALDPIGAQGELALEG